MKTTLLVFNVKKTGDKEYEISGPLHCPFRFVHIDRDKKETECQLSKTKCPDYEKRPDACPLIKGIELKLKEVK